MKIALLTALSLFSYPPLGFAGSSPHTPKNCRIIIARKDCAKQLKIHFSLLTHILAEAEPDMRRSDGRIGYSQIQSTITFTGGTSPSSLHASGFKSITPCGAMSRT
jgi:hypothetical protein